MVIILSMNMEDAKIVAQGAADTLLLHAAQHASRRGSKIIREIDVKAAIEKIAVKEAPKWYFIPVSGNGACLCE